MATLALSCAMPAEALAQQATEQKGDQPVLEEIVITADRPERQPDLPVTTPVVM